MTLGRSIAYAGFALLLVTVIPFSREVVAFVSAIIGIFLISTAMYMTWRHKVQKFTESIYGFITIPNLFDSIERKAFKVVATSVAQQSYNANLGKTFSAEPYQSALTPVALSSEITAASPAVATTTRKVRRVVRRKKTVDSTLPVIQTPVIDGKPEIDSAVVIRQSIRQRAVQSKISATIDSAEMITNRKNVLFVGPVTVVTPERPAHIAPIQSTPLRYDEVATYH